MKMSNTKRIVFPCGYTFYNSEELICVPLFGRVKLDRVEFPLCPLHGSDCSSYVVGNDDEQR